MRNVLVRPSMDEDILMVTVTTRQGPREDIVTR